MIKHADIIYPSNLTATYTCTPKRNENVFIQNILESVQQHYSRPPKCPSADEWINEMWHVHTVECYSATKRSAVPIWDSTWVNFEITVLKGRSQAQKIMCCRMSFI